MPRGTFPPIMLTWTLMSKVHVFIRKYIYNSSFDSSDIRTSSVLSAVGRCWLVEARSRLAVRFGSGTRIVKRDGITVSSQLQPLPFQTSHLTPVPEEVWVTDVGDRNDCISSFFVIRFQVSRSPRNRREREQLHNLKHSHR